LPPTILRIMRKSKQPEQFLEKFREISRQLSRRGIIHVANLIFNHPGETEETLKETFAFIDSLTGDGNSSLIWAVHEYMHFPGSEVSNNQTHYEQAYGAVFPNQGWWREDGNLFEKSRQIIPSTDLSGDRTKLWSRMYKEREEALRGNLTPAAFRFAAEAFYSSWRNDPRYSPDPDIINPSPEA